MRTYYFLDVGLDMFDKYDINDFIGSIRVIGKIRDRIHHTYYLVFDEYIDNAEEVTITP